MLNKIILLGRMCNDPEIRKTGSGVTVASFCVAVDQDYAPKDGAERKTDFINCTAWRHTGDFISKYFPKGKMICVEGRLEIQAWEDRDGNKRRSAQVNVQNVYFCGDGKKDGQSGAQSAGRYDPALPVPDDYAVLTGDDPGLPFYDEYEQVPM